MTASRDTLAHAELMFSVHCYAEISARTPWTKWWHRRRWKRWFRIMDVIIKERQRL